MSQPAFLEISDNCVRVTEGGRQAYAEPGIALLAPGTAPVLGREAQKVLRQQPTRIHSRYWSELSTDPIRMKDASVRHGADLVWHQLSQIKQEIGTENLCFCLPSQMNHAQMQLLTGICGSLDLNVGYLVNTGLAQLAAREIEEDALHVDLQLHQLVISNYSNKDGALAFENQESIKSISYLRIVDRFMHVLRDQFIQASRFDPLHSGDTEQQLFDQVLKLLGNGQLTAFEIRSGTQTHRVEPSLKDFSSLVTTLKQELDQILPDNRPCIYSPEFALLPNFQVAGHDIILSSEDTLLGAEKLIQTQSETEGPVFVSSWQASTDSPVAQPSAHKEGPESSTQPANAILYQGIVFRAKHFEKLSGAGFSLQNFAINSDGLLIETATDSPVDAGKAIHSDGETATAVYLLD